MRASSRGWMAARCPDRARRAPHRCARRRHCRSIPSSITSSKSSCAGRAPVCGAAPAIERARRELGKPVLAAGYDAAAGGWQAGGTGAWTTRNLRFARADWRTVPAASSRKQLTTFRDAVQKWAEVQAAISVKSRTPRHAHAMAVQLDRFCADVDIAIGVNVVTRTAARSPAPRSARWREAAGIQARAATACFTCATTTAGTLLHARQSRADAVRRSRSQRCTTSGMTFLLDVPRVAEAARRFERMLRGRAQLRATLDGELVDDNGRRCRTTRD